LAASQAFEKTKHYSQMSARQLDYAEEDLVFANALAVFCQHGLITAKVNC